jgi:hypothetical protein
VSRLETLVALALVVAIAIMAGVLTARADECLATKPRGQKGQYFQWRTIDNRTCWYAGRSKKAKSQLHWAARVPTQPPDAEPVGTAIVEESAVSSSLSSGPDGTFLRRWRDVMNELAFPWWQDRTEVRTWTGVLSGGR